MVFILPLIAVGVAGAGAWLLRKQVGAGTAVLEEKAGAIGTGILGAGLLGGGFALTKIVPPMLPKNKKKYGYLPGLATALGGTYFLYRAFVPGKGTETAKKPIEEIEKEGLRFPVTILRPTHEQVLGMWGAEDFSVHIQNPQDEKYTCYVGMSMKDPRGNVTDFEAQQVTIEAKGSKKVTWKFNFNIGHQGLWEVITRTWNISPYEGCLDAGKCVILGDSGWRRFAVGVKP